MSGNSVVAFLTLVLTRLNQHLFPCLQTAARIMCAGVQPITTNYKEIVDPNINILTSFTPTLYFLSSMKNKRCQAMTVAVKLQTFNLFMIQTHFIFYKHFHVYPRLWNICIQHQSSTGRDMLARSLEVVHPKMKISYASFNFTRCYLMD